MSVIVPIRNAADHVPQLLERLDRLRGPDLEFIVVDDHSTDEGPRLVEKWRPIHGRRMRLVHAAGRGVAAARNEAAGQASGEYLWFTDSDDDWDPDIVARLLAAARAGGHDVAVCNAARVTPAMGTSSIIEDAPVAGVASGREAVRRLLRGELQGHLWNKLFRRALFDLAEFPATRAHSDLGGTLQLLAHARSVAFTPEVLYFYLIRQGSILNSRDYRWKDLDEVLAIARRVAAGSGPDADPDLRLFAYRNVWLALAHEAIRRSRGEDSDAARAAWSTARRSMRWTDLVRLATDGHRRLAAEGLAIKGCPPVYRRLYSLYRQRRWEELDERVVPGHEPRRPAG